LLNGKGAFPKEDPAPISQKAKNENIQEIGNALSDQIIKPTVTKKIIERIVMFYSDGTFKEYIQ
jgi:hypothetical protein